MPTRHFALPKLGEYDFWSAIRWKPDGKAIAIHSEAQTLIVDVYTGTVVKKLAGNRFVWWIGTKLCTASFTDYGSKMPPDAQVWQFDGKPRKLPPGLFIDSISRDGHAIMLQEAASKRVPRYSEKETMTLIVLDENGNIKWQKHLRSPGRADYHCRLYADYNSKLGSAARVADTSGGPTYSCFVESTQHEVEMQLVEGERETHFTTDFPRWLDDRHLFVPVQSAHHYSADQMTFLSAFHNRLAIYDAVTRKIRPVYESDSMVGAHASNRYVAIIERKGKAADIVISEWRRAAKGEIISPKYVPTDAPTFGLEREDWTRFVVHSAEIKPLTQHRSRARVFRK